MKKLGIVGILIFSMIYIIWIIYCYGISILAFSYISLYAMLLLLTLDDLKSKTLSLDITICFGAFSLLLLPLNPNISLVWTIVVALITIGTFCVIHLFTKGGIGLGDVWVIGISILILGWQNGITLLVVALICSGLLSTFLLIIRKVNRKAKIPFIPFLFGIFIVMTLI